MYIDVYVYVSGWVAYLELRRELVRLLRAVEEVPVPQKWVQSSLALLVEAGVAPPRVGPIHPATWVASRVKLQILGWNKSRLSLACTSEDECQETLLEEIKSLEVLRSRF